MSSGYLRTLVLAGLPINSAISHVVKVTTWLAMLSAPGFLRETHLPSDAKASRQPSRLQDVEASHGGKTHIPRHRHETHDFLARHPEGRTRYGPRPHPHGHQSTAWPVRRVRARDIYIPSHCNGNHGIRLRPDERACLARWSH